MPRRLLRREAAGRRLGDELGRAGGGFLDGDCFGGRAIGQGMATAHACEGLARNPGAEAAIRFALILGLVLIESMALYTFAIIFLKVK